MSLFAGPKVAAHGSPLCTFGRRRTDCYTRKAPRRRMHALAAAGSTDTAKTALVTGANSGIGFITVKELAKQGYRVVMACRDVDKAQAAKAKILQEAPSAKIEVQYMDLADLATIRAFTDKALAFGGHLDLLINNAGVMATPPMTTKDGFEFQLGVNHLSHFLLTQSLLPLMMSGRPARIINVASSAHQFGTIKFHDLMSKTDYSPWPVYGQSKLANILHAYELSRRLSADANITVNALHPGVVGTNLGRYLIDDTKWYTKPLVGISKIFLKTPEQGAATSLYLATSPDIEGVTGKYFSDCRPQTSNKESYDTEVARRLW
eukprot:CAMPEP_0206149152 /NCGR_PEP_ID=MMETSP1473-20131121/37629_1 /ASSEMBLY_ACC=CAM_ASM_001109 /TAXON_ID=1461547 /ORGANISM="Stichococcus sp, Strain RCC1054" /LENGTH=319 /DNA_ID=CAMNT_0053546601 /DNA_START=74 /DNA_END=1030 /DNA_ORIENTATION=+